MTGRRFESLQELKKQDFLSGGLQLASFMCSGRSTPILSRQATFVVD
jgi:hypothetical protein